MCRAELQSRLIISDSFHNSGQQSFNGGQSVIHNLVLHIHYEKNETFYTPEISGNHGPSIF